MNTLKVKREDLNELRTKTNTPIYGYCRKLIAEGVDPETKLEIYGKFDEPDVTVPNIGEAAKLTIRDDPTLCVVPYKFKEVRKGVHRSL